MNRQAAALYLSDIYGVPFQWFDNLIQKESGWNPLAVAGEPYNLTRIAKGLDTQEKYAKGLLQFIDSTAQEIGYNDSQDIIDSEPDLDSQIKGAVKKYLDLYKPYSTKQSLYLAVFYPSMRFVDPKTPFPANVQAGNPFKTVEDYVTWIDKGTSGIIPGVSNPLLLIAGIALLSYILLTHK